MREQYKMISKIVGLELLLVFFFTLNGAFVTIVQPSSPSLHYIALLPMAIGIYVYLFKTGQWNTYFSPRKLTPLKETSLLSSPLLIILVLILFAHKGIDTTSILDLILLLFTQLFIVAFIEEIFFRGFMLRVVASKGFKTAVIVSSLLFAITHSLQLLGGHSLEDTLLQILYAFFVGIVLSLLIVNRQSIMIAIAFHGLNNFFILEKNTEGPAFINYVLIIILLLYAIYLWIRASKLTNVDVSNQGHSIHIVN
ncbi:CPBP family intramembrane glutamic endopeptidase [Bacillus salitolerans]|uniref:CPBP family intramembrane glutamic endopeptidase n=1 Tax=Bacillus salitolerans TaxID=1437434 RepID=A0ABW4LY63_9BACI